MSKTLNETAMATELGGSAFFKQHEIQAADHKERDAASNHGPNTASMPSNKPDVGHDMLPPRSHATMPPSAQEEDLVETIRRAVKQLGKEEATYRLTVPEKKAMADIVFRYSLEGIKTSQNEITRIAVNQLLENHRREPSNSILVRVIERLNE